jgi:hypothetical protein
VIHQPGGSPWKLTCITNSPDSAGPARTTRLHRKRARERQGVTYDQRRTRAVAGAAIWEAALVKNHRRT